MKKSIVFLIRVFSLPFILISCSKDKIDSPQEVLKEIVKVANSQDTSTLFRLDSLIDFKWDRLVIIRPYQGEILLKKCDYDFSLLSSKINVTEGLDEYLFINDKKIIKHIVNANQDQAIQLIIEDSLKDNPKYECGIPNANNIFIKNIYLEDTALKKLLIVVK